MRMTSILFAGALCASLVFAGSAGAQLLGGAGGLTGGLTGGLSGPGGLSGGLTGSASGRGGFGANPDLMGHIGDTASRIPRPTASKTGGAVAGAAGSGQAAASGAAASGQAASGGAAGLGQTMASGAITRPVEQAEVRI